MSVHVAKTVHARDEGPSPQFPIAMSVKGRADCHHAALRGHFRLRSVGPTEMAYELTNLRSVADNETNFARSLSYVRRSVATQRETPEEFSRFAVSLPLVRVVQGLEEEHSRATNPPKRMNNLREEEILRSCV
ncbi:hypothetical protein CA13_27250 [Planctomycetes bacterium CA13]|uniref:Uncharacterized protein n=1 Tax=Novipirellula herctigrandis TaxID=2527986 RepID=A0A5C5Z1T1_9BACT|nr:hypothetical protein CA13_27250 [Planctomycetes bacterium CA13]